MVLKKFSFILLFVLVSCGGNSNEGASQISLDGGVKKVTKALSACDKNESDSLKFFYPYRCSDYYGGIFLFPDELPNTQKCIELTNEVLKGLENNVCNSSNPGYLTDFFRKGLEKLENHEKKIQRYIEENEVSWKADRNKRDCDKRKGQLTYKELSLLTFNDDCSNAKLDLTSFVDHEVSIQEHFQKDEPELCENLREGNLSQKQSKRLFNIYTWLSINIEVVKDKGRLNDFKDYLKLYGIYTYSDYGSVKSVIYKFEHTENEDDRNVFNDSYSLSLKHVEDNLFYSSLGKVELSLGMTNYGACQFARNGQVDTRNITIEEVMNKFLEVNIHKVLIP